MPGRWASPSTRRAGAHRGVSQEEAPHVVPAGNPVAPSASHVASRATTSPVEQLDLFALLAPRIAHLGAALRKPRVETHLSGQSTSVWPFLGAQLLAVETAEATAQTGALTASVFDAYRSGIRVPGACPHPTRLVESAAMAAAIAPQSDYRPTLPEHLVSRGLLSDAQLETVSRAGAAHAEHLPGSGEEAGPRQGFFLGDGTGVGKGRQSAALILDNILQGRRRALWVSENRSLMRDAVRDWTALGGPDRLRVRPRCVQGADPACRRHLLRELRHAQGQAPRERRRRVRHRPAGAGRGLARRWGRGVRVRGRRSSSTSRTTPLPPSTTQGSRGVKKASQRALAVVDLQDRLA